MFKVEVDTVEAYLAFNPARRGDLEGVCHLIQTCTELPQHFHAGTPAGQPGMRFKMIGYGRVLTERGVEWPLIGVALQKNYISVYLPAAVAGPYRGRLGEVRMGQGNFSFIRFAALNSGVAADMFREMSHDRTIT